MKVATEEDYLAKLAQAGVEVLHVDTEHATPDGFWYAARGNISQHRGARSFTWNYQPFGMWCGYPSGGLETLVFNPWLNRYTCEPDDTAMTSLDPDWASKTQACREQTGIPWTNYSGAVAGGCENWSALYKGYEASLKFEGGRGEICAPWEPQTAPYPSVSVKKSNVLCDQIHYTWESATPNSFWNPAPDSCAAVPADINMVAASAHPGLEELALRTGGDGTCTGAAQAPNCADLNANQSHPACTGVAEALPPANVTATASATATIDSPSTATRTARATAHLGSVTRRVSTRYRGHTYRAKARVWIRRSVRATKTVTIDVPGFGAATQTCAAISLPLARACADAKAEPLAQWIAEGDAALRALSNSDGAGTPAQKAANQAAAAAAKTAAKTLSKSGEPTRAEKAKAAKTARAAARKRLKQLVASAKSRRMGQRMG
jgi:hypothetical protein